MAMRKPQTRSSGRTFVSVVLVAAAVVLAVVFWQLSDAVSANRKNPALWVYLIGMRYLTTVLLLLTVVLLAMRGVRWLVARFKPQPPVEPTSQVSAWVEAGKRFELPADDQGEDGESPSDT